MEILNTINLIIVIAIGVIAIHNFTHLKRYRNDKSKLIKDISVLYPLVKEDFVTKPLARQTAENNHEIHEINKRLEVVDEEFKRIESKLNEIMEAIKHNG